MSEGRSGDCIYCPSCGCWRNTEIVKHLSGGYERTDDGRSIWISRMKRKCTGCKHNWIEVTKYN